MVTLVYAYFNNGSMLDLHLKVWAKYREKRKWKAVIVDDCSLKDPAKDHIVDVGFPVEIYRIHTDIPWNQDGARNLAMHHAEGWCLMTDMDHLLTPNNAERVLRLSKSEDTFYVPSRLLSDGSKYHRHPNSYLIHSGLFNLAGGYDEAFAGYYGTDSVFRSQLKRVGTRKDLDIPLVVYKREVIPDASTTQYGRKGSEYEVGANPELSRRKKLKPPPIKPLNFEWSRVC
ncbi:MAG: glycosyltransferase [Chloroflexia bacterium]|nr:glycosyltransferase [Chloroflexia bacterium]